MLPSLNHLAARLSGYLKTVGRPDPNLEPTFMLPRLNPVPSPWPQKELRGARTCTEMPKPMTSPSCCCVQFCRKLPPGPLPLPRTHFPPCPPTIRDRKDQRKRRLHAPLPPESPDPLHPAVTSHGWHTCAQLCPTPRAVCTPSGLQEEGRLCTQ